MNNKIVLLCVFLVVSLSSCEFITELFGLSEESNTRVEKITHTFQASDALVYINYRSDNQKDSTFVINTAECDITSRIIYGENEGEYRAIQVTPYEDRLWLLGSYMSKKILIFNPETGVTEKEITFSEDNLHRINFLPSLGYAAVMHGNSYGNGFCVSLINIATECFEKTVYVQTVAPILKDINGTIYGIGNDMGTPTLDKGFGIYTLDGNNLNLETLFPLSPASNTIGSCLVDVNKFLILEDGTFVVCDYTIGLKIKYPDGSVGELARDNIPFNPDIGNYKNVDNIYYSQKYDRIYVEKGLDELYVVADKDTDGRWKWNNTIMLSAVSESDGKKNATKINGDILVVTLRNTSNTVFTARFYAIEKFDLIKEVRWDLQTDTKTEITPTAQ